jgi:hypothetical protein
MNDDRLLRIANRINLLLLRELGQGIDVKRMISQPRYARDVLLVCDARPGTDIASLALHFRHVRREQANGESSPPPRRGIPSPRFGLSRPPELADSSFGIGVMPAARTARPWFSPARWMGL